jgi:hypothetical protein
MSLILLLTKKRDYNDNFFRKLDHMNAYFLKWIPHGKNDVLEVQTVKIGEFMMMLNLWDTKKCLCMCIRDN